MTEAVARLTVTADASQVVVQGRAAGTALQALIDKTTGVTTSTRSASEAARAFLPPLESVKREVTQLKSAYEPMFAANQRLEAGTETLTNALMLQQIELAEHDRLLAALRAEYRATEIATEAMTRATGRWSSITRGGAGGMQNFAFQLQDVFTQVGMGVPLMVSLGQQAPQLLSGFGAVGAILGVVAAAALPLGAAIFGLGYAGREAGDEALTLADRMDGLHEAIQAYTEASEAATVSTAALSEQYGIADAAARGFLEGQAARAEVEALREMEAVVQEIAGQFEAISGFSQRELLGSIGGEAALQARVMEIFALNAGLAAGSAASQALAAELNQLYAASRQFPVIERALLEIRDALGLTHDQAAVVAARFLDLAQAQGLTAQADAATRLVAALEAALGPQEQMEGRAREIVDSLIEAGLAALELREEVDDSYESLLLVAGVDFSGTVAQIVDLSRELGVSTARALELAAALPGYEAGGVSGPDAALGAVRNRLTMTGMRRDDIVLQETFVGQNNRPGRTRPRTRAGGGGGSASTLHDRTIADIERRIRALAGSYEMDIAAAERWRETSLENLDATATGYDEFAAHVDTIYNDMLAEAYQSDLDRRVEWQAGILRGLAEVEDAQRSWADTFEDVTVGMLERGEDAWVEWTMTGRASLRDLADFAIEQFARMAYQQSIQPALSGVFNWASGLFGGGGTNAATTLLRSHSGSIVGAGTTRATMQSLGAGDALAVVRSGQGIFTPRQMEGANSLIASLAALASRPQTGNDARPQVIINDRRGAGAGPVEVSERADGTTEINIMDQVEREMAGRAQKPGSPMNSALKSMGLGPRYGAGRR